MLAEMVQLAARKNDAARERSTAAIMAAVRGLDAISEWKPEERAPELLDRARKELAIAQNLVNSKALADLIRIPSMATSVLKLTRDALIAQLRGLRQSLQDARELMEQSRNGVQAIVEIYLPVEFKQLVGTVASIATEASTYTQYLEATAEAHRASDHFAKLGEDACRRLSDNEAAAKASGAIIGGILGLIGGFVAGCIALIGIGLVLLIPGIIVEVAGHPRGMDPVFHFLGALGFLVCLVGGAYIGGSGVGEVFRNRVPGHAARKPFCSGFPGATIETKVDTDRNHSTQGNTSAVCKKIWMFGACSVAPVV